MPQIIHFKEREAGIFQNDYEWGEASATAEKRDVPMQSVPVNRENKS